MPFADASKLNPQTVKTEAKIILHDKQEIFTHYDDDGIVRVFLVGTMKTFIDDYPHCADVTHIHAPIMDHHTAHIKTNGGIEPERLERLVDPYLSEPCIGIRWNDKDKSILIVDGNHRILKLHEQGKTSFRLHVVDHPLWENFLMPEEMHEGYLEKHPNPLTDPSGVLEHERGEL